MTALEELCDQWQWQGGAGAWAGPRTEQALRGLGDPLPPHPHPPPSTPSTSDPPTTSHLPAHHRFAPSHSLAISSRLTSPPPQTFSFSLLLLTVYVVNTFHNTSPTCFSFKKLRAQYQVTYHRKRHTQSWMTSVCANYLQILSKHCQNTQQGLLSLFCFSSVFLHE